MIYERIPKILKLK